MMYKLITTQKKNVHQEETWEKHGVTLVHSMGWRWGTVSFEDKPDLTGYDQEVGIELYGMDIIDHELDDCVWEEWEYRPGIVNDEEQVQQYKEEVEEFIELNGFVDLEELSWEQVDSELWFKGPLEVVEEDV